MLCKCALAALEEIAQLATQLNMQPQVINEYESGKAVPNNAVIAKIEKALGCKLPRAPKK